MATVIQDGTAEDLIRSFVQVACAEGHTKTLIEKFMAELNNGMVDVEDEAVRQAHLEKLNDSIVELELLAELRRSIMRRLMDMYGGDKDYWCLVKHLGVGAYTLFEAYQASDGDTALMDLAISANARFVKALSRFLKTEITDCAACFADILKGEEKGETTDG